MMWYFNNKFKKGAPALFGLYDNDGQTPKTPTLWQDDVLRYKFCSGIGEVESSTYSQKAGGGEYLSVFSQLRSYVLK
jgi:hypothetical protein